LEKYHSSKGGRGGIPCAWNLNDALNIIDRIQEDGNSHSRDSLITKGLIGARRHLPREVTLDFIELLEREEREMMEKKKKGHHFQEL
jgi:hypothetical protein